MPWLRSGKGSIRLIYRVTAGGTTAFQIIVLEQVAHLPLKGNESAKACPVLLLRGARFFAVSFLHFLETSVAQDKFPVGRALAPRSDSSLRA